MKSNLTGLGCLGILLIILFAVAVHIVLIPFLLMLVLNALGVAVGFWVCCGIWVLLTTLVGLLK